MGSDPVELDFAMPINELSEVEELRRELREALEARTSELSEALQEQRGTAEILRRMSNSPSNAQPVFLLFWRALYACARPNLPLRTGWKAKWCTWWVTTIFH